MSLTHLKNRILEESSKTTPEKASRFFKTTPGTYGAHDRFLGIPVPILRRIAKEHAFASPQDLAPLMTSSYNEERLLALIILTEAYKKGALAVQETIFRFYMDHKAHVNNWNLVDASAHLILGPHIFQKNEEMLLELVRSPHLWDRRIAVVATWHFIKRDAHAWTLRLTEMLLDDPEDLMHKACGWMLREVGKKDKAILLEFLDLHAPSMPRTLLRYAIERFTPEERREFLNKK